MSKNATLVINNGEGFENDIWQTFGGFNKSQWEEAIKCLADNLQTIYDALDSNTDESEALQEEFGYDIYQLGDVINLLKNIDIKKTRA